MYIIAFNDSGMLGMANPKVALKSKATATVASVQIISGQELLPPLIISCPRRLEQS